MKMFSSAATFALTVCVLAQSLVNAENQAADRAGAKSLEIVLSQEANELERFAATELQRYLKRLFGASATLLATPTKSADAFFLLGISSRSPDKAIESKTLPPLSNQGFLLRHSTCMDKPALAIIGGSPAATLWAVYELVERYGVTYLLSGDVYPETQQAFHLPDIDQVFEPTFQARWFKTMGDFAMGMEGWGMADYRPFLDQLAKLKYNRIRIGGCNTAPFLDMEIRGVKKQSAILWYGDRYPITPDMPGRKLFGNDTEFWNPDLPLPGVPYAQSIAAGQHHMHKLIAYAHSRGIEASSVWSLTDFPKEFRSVIPDAKSVQQLGALTVAPGPGARPDQPDLLEIGGTVIRTILNEYPDADLYGFSVGTEFPSWISLYEWAWQELDKQYSIESVLPLKEALRKAGRRADHWGGGAERSVNEVKGHITGLYYLLRLWNSPDVRPKSRKPDARLVLYDVAEELWPILPHVLPKNAELAIVMDYNSTRVLRRRSVLATLPAKQVPISMVLTLHDDSVGTLPMLTTTALHELVGDMRKYGVSSFGTRQWLISDHDTSAAYLAKAAWDPKTTPETVYRAQVRAVCGPAAVAPMLEMFHEIETVTSRLEDHGMQLTFPYPGMMIDRWTPDSFPAPFLEDQAIYQRALDAARNVPAPSRPEGKAYVQYWTARLQFAVEYFDALRAVTKGAVAEKAAGDARQKGDAAAYRANLAEAVQDGEAAHAAAFHAIDTYAAVAKNRADAGAVATMAEHVCRQLQRKIEALRAEHDKAQ